MSHANSTQCDGDNRIRAGLIAPLPIPVLVFAIKIIFDYNPRELLEWPAALFYFAGVYLSALIGFIVLGVPAIKILSRIGRLRIWTLMIAGMVEGALIGYSFYLLFGGVGPGHTSIQPDIYRELPDIAMLSLFGMLVAAAFGIAAKIRFR